MWCEKTIEGFHFTAMLSIPENAFLSASLIHRSISNQRPSRYLGDLEHSIRLKITMVFSFTSADAWTSTNVIPISYHSLSVYEGEVMMLNLLAMYCFKISELILVFVLFHTVFPSFITAKGGRCSACNQDAFLQICNGFCWGGKRKGRFLFMLYSFHVFSTKRTQKCLQQNISNFFELGLAQQYKLWFIKADAESFVKYSTFCWWYHRALL